MAITTRAGKGAALTHTEMDTNFTELAPLASPALTGNPTSATPSAGDNDTSIATTAFVHGEFLNQPYQYLYLGSGADGSKTVAASENLAPGEYHYTDLTINGSQILGLSAPGMLLIRCTGTVTIIGTIDVDGDGAIGGLDGDGGGSGGGGSGSGAVSGVAGGDSTFLSTISGGAGGITTGTDGVATDQKMINNLLSRAPLHDTPLSGAGGGQRYSSGPAGGNGGGGILIIADTIDFQAGATLTADGDDGGSGAGGGGGGVVIIVAGTMTNDGTITVTGGLGTTSFFKAGDGGDGYSTAITL